RNTYGRPAFQRRDSINRPTKPADTFGPIKTARHLVSVELWLRSRAGFVGKQHRPRVTFERGEEVHPAPTLGATECTSIDHPVAPPVPQSLQGRRYDVHGTAPAQLQHEGHVLQ